MAARVAFACRAIESASWFLDDRCVGATFPTIICAVRFSLVVDGGICAFGRCCFAGLRICFRQGLPRLGVVCGTLSLVASRVRRVAA